VALEIVKHPSNDGRGRASSSRQIHVLEALIHELAQLREALQKAVTSRFSSAPFAPMARDECEPIASRAIPGL
jgi:hypothetical protein